MDELPEAPVDLVGVEDVLRLWRGGGERKGERAVLVSPRASAPAWRVWGGGESAGAAPLMQLFAPSSWFTTDRENLAARIQPCAAPGPAASWLDPSRYRDRCSAWLPAGNTSRRLAKGVPGA